MVFVYMHLNNKFQKFEILFKSFHKYVIFNQISLIFKSKLIFVLISHIFLTNFDEYTIFLLIDDYKYIENS